MKRRLRIIAVFLLLGAVVNVAVAWGCVAWIYVEPETPRYRFAIAEDGHSYVYWAVDSWPRIGAVRISSYWRTQGVGYFPATEATPEDIVPAWGEFLRPVDNGDSAPFHLRAVDGRGWPMVSMWSGFEFEVFSDPESRHSRGKAIGDAKTVKLGLELAPHPGKLATPSFSTRVLPLGIIWPGFLGNTLLYAALLWLLIPGPFALRRFLRLRRGLCPKCAYPMGESAACTECGRALP